jgi:hypothetical protein
VLGSDALKHAGQPNDDCRSSPQSRPHGLFPEEIPVTYARFEDLPVWKEAIRLANGVYDMTENNGWKGSRSLRDQIERAALSVSNNIAEGFERGTTNELLAFL